MVIVSLEDEVFKLWNKIQRFLWSYRLLCISGQIICHWLSLSVTCVPVEVVRFPGLLVVLVLAVHWKNKEAEPAEWRASQTYDENYRSIFRDLLDDAGQLVPAGNVDDKDVDRVTYIVIVVHRCGSDRGVACWGTN